MGIERGFCRGFPGNWLCDAGSRAGRLFSARAAADCWPGSTSMNRTSTDRGWGQFIQGTVTVAIFLALISTDCQRRTGAEVEPRHESGIALAASSMPTSQGSSMTPRMPVPKAAEELTNAFADAATAMRGSVVRVNVEL